MNKLKVLGTVVAVIGFMVTSSEAQTTLNQSGSWTNPAIWSANVPVSGVRVDMRNDSTATIHAGDVAASGEVRIGVTESAALLMEGGTLTASSHIRVGHNTAGTLNIQGGQVSNSGNQLNVAYLANSSGLVNMSGGSLTVGAVQHGREGTGTLNLSNGTFTATGAFQLGVNANGHGVINQTGGSIVMDGTSNFEIGKEGSGEYHMSGGSFETTRDFVVGNEAGAGTFRVSGTNASLTLRQFTLGENATYIADIGDSGNGITTITMNDWRTLNLGGDLILNLPGSSLPPSTVVLFQNTGTGGIDGTFDNVQWNNGLSGDVVYDEAAGEMRLENVIPEPSTMGLIAIGLLAALWRRRMLA